MLIMNSKVYKWCSVPQCVNTSIKTPNKLFVYVPHKKTVRNKWLNLARRDPTAICLNSPIYFCEDHFDLPNDMVNFMQYHVMGSVSQVRMKPGCIPTKFECQSRRRKRTTNTTEHILKKQKMLTEECLLNVKKESSITTKQLELGETSSGILDGKKENITQEEHKTEIKLENQMISPLEPNLLSVETSPFKITECSTITNLSTSTLHQPSIKIKIEEQSDSDLSTPSVMHRESSPSTISIQIKSTSDCSELMQDGKKHQASQILEYTLFKISKNPLSYIGLVKNCYYLIGLIEENTNISASHILMCLKKIRLNNSFRELADDFSMTPTYARKIFLKNIPLIASVMHPFIVKLNKDSIKKNLPMAFRHKYHHVSCIIGSLEIEIKKPPKALDQSLSWSEYKKANTVKYLVSCTPNSLVNYISPGYGGRVTDTCLVESCDFIKCLQPGMCVMADGGFKHVELYLRKHGVNLVRTPSVTTGAELSTTEAMETEHIASLRIHVERVIHGLRKFSMLKPHACVNHNLVKVLDHVITIACGLINLQDCLIK